MLLSILLFFSTQLLPPLDEIRISFQQSMENWAKAKVLYQQLNVSNASLPPIYLGYLGATDALLAKHEDNPYKKITHLNKSQDRLEEAIGKTPYDIELRFLRFSIEHRLPAFLRNNKNLQEDRDVIVSELAKLKKYPPLMKTIAEAMLESKRCSSQQQAILRKIVENS
jgi:hypothetical protein